MEVTWENDGKMMETLGKPGKMMEILGKTLGSGKNHAHWGSQGQFLKK